MASKSTIELLFLNAPHSFDARLPLILAIIRMNLILLKAESLGYISAFLSMGLSSFKFL